MRTSETEHQADVADREDIMTIAFQDPIDLLASDLFAPMGAEGVHARRQPFEQVIDGLHALISREREPETEVFRFPPVMSRRQLERSGYLNSFPQLLGGVCCLHGEEADIHAAVNRFNAGEDWTPALAPTDLVLAPAACYPVYPIAAERGPVPARGLKFDVSCDCFRREASRHLDRMQSFRMREYVDVGSADGAVEFRERWKARASELAADLGLPFTIAPASDPFFGRTGRIMASNQVEQALKFELLIPIRAERPTACMSFNCHRAHFGIVWGLKCGAETAHTACAAFGMDRLALALFATHGRDPIRWPAPVRKTLSL
jgi:seryl-tRNA synthetase